VSTEVERRNVDKDATIRALREYIKDKDAEIAFLKGEKDPEKKKNGVLITMAEEIDDHAL
ncbi:hypothetical protein KI387_024686, partial [Taxus chinensis]